MTTQSRPVPPDAVTAALAAVRERYETSASDERDNRSAFIKGDVSAALHAAAPAIREDERDQSRDGLRDAIRRVEHLAASAQELAVRTAVAAERETWADARHRLVAAIRCSCACGNCKQALTGMITIGGDQQ